MNSKACRKSAEEFRLVRSNTSMRLRPERIIYYIPRCGAGVPTMEHVINEGPVWTFVRDQLDSWIESVDDPLYVRIYSDYFLFSSFFYYSFVLKRRKLAQKTDIQSFKEFSSETSGFCSPSQRNVTVIHVSIYGSITFLFSSSICMFFCSIPFRKLITI